MTELYVKCPACSEIFDVKTSLMLTKRELEVAQMLARGIKVRDIAEKLCICTKTVESHRQKIYDKTQTRNPSELTLWAVRNGLIEL